MRAEQPPRRLTLPSLARLAPEHQQAFVREVESTSLIPLIPERPQEKALEPQPAARPSWYGTAAVASGAALLKPPTPVRPLNGSKTANHRIARVAGFVQHRLAEVRHADCCAIRFVGGN